MSLTPLFFYDAFNRMDSAGGMAYYVNPEGQRLRKSGAAGTSYFAPGSSGAMLAEYSSGGWIDYVWLNGRLIGRVAGGQRYAIHDDQTGRPEAVTDGSGAVVWRAQNFAFTQNVTTAGIALNLGFPGQYYDAETSAWNNGFRDYKSALGRYVESDPVGLGGGVNTYAYVSGNPLSNIDPYGLAVGTIGVNGVLAHITGLTAGVGYYIDSYGNYGTYKTIGGAFSTPENASVGISVSYFGSLGNGDPVSYQDFAGAFINGSLGGGADGAAGSVDGYIDPMNPTHFGGGFTLGAGIPGASGTLGASNTEVCPGGNVKVDIMSAIANRINMMMMGRSW